MIEQLEQEAQGVIQPNDVHAYGGHGTVDPIEFARVGLVAIAATAVWFQLWEPLPHISIIGIVATLIGGYPIFKAALENIAERRMTMELSMTIALFAALSIGQAFTALIITGFVLVAEILEHLTVSRGREAIGDLLRYLPQTALVRRNGTIREIRATELRIGDSVLVNPGAIVPVDGFVSSGSSFIDEANITGESLPAEKYAGSKIFAGTINQLGVLEASAERIGRDTSFGRIIDAVESAEKSRAPIERLADRLAGYLVYFALGAAILTFLITRNIVSTISVIIVAGACGIAAGTPLAVLGAVGRAARAGAIIKGGRYLEALASVDTVVFDKTGTLTYGTPEVRTINPAPGVSLEALLSAAATAECRSEHPLAIAIVAYADAHAIAYAEPEKFAYTPGRGIRAHRGEDTILVGSRALLDDNRIAASDTATPELTTVYVAIGERYFGTICLADAIRAEAGAAVAALRLMAIRVELLTGDIHEVATAVGETLRVDQVRAELLPEEKSAYIASLVATGQKVVMVGDGVNDAPALSCATIGVAMGSGTDVARESADIVLLGNDLLKFVETVRIARRTKLIVMQNFAGTIAVDSFGILLAAFGMLSPLLAAFIHVASELAFILNSTRMLASRGPGHRVKN